MCSSIEGLSCRGLSDIAPSRFPDGTHETARSSLLLEELVTVAEADSSYGRRIGVLYLAGNKVDPCNGELEWMPPAGWRSKLDHLLEGIPCPGTFSSFAHTLLKVDELR